MILSFSFTVYTDLILRAMSTANAGDKNDKNNRRQKVSLGPGRVMPGQGPEGVGAAKYPEGAVNPRFIPPRQQSVHTGICRVHTGIRRVHTGIHMVHTGICRVHTGIHMVHTGIPYGIRNVQND